MDPSLPGVIDASGDSSAVQREVRFVWSSGLCRMARPELLGIILVGASAWLWLLPGRVGGEEGQLQTQLAATQCFSGRERGATQFDDGNAAILELRIEHLQDDRFLDNRVIFHLGLRTACRSSNHFI